VTECHVECWDVLLMSWMCIPQLKVTVMMCVIGCMRNWNGYLVSVVSTVWKVCYEISVERIHEFGDCDGIKLVNFDISSIPINLLETGVCICKCTKKNAPRNPFYTGWRTKCHTIDCTHNTFLLLQKHLTPNTELILIGWKIVPNEEHVQCDHCFASQPLANEPLH